MVDPLAHRDLAALAVALLQLLAAALQRLTVPLAQRGDQIGVERLVAVEFRTPANSGFQQGVKAPGRLADRSGLL